MNSQEQSSIIAKYQDYLSAKRGLSEYTVRNYISDINSFFNFTRKEKISDFAEITRGTLREYLTKLITESHPGARDGYSRYSVARKLSAVRSFYRFLKSEGVTDRDPSLGVLSAKTGKRLPSFLDHKEMISLIMAPDTSTHIGLRDRAILEMLYSSGLRVSELVNVDIENLNLDSMELKTRGKGDKERIVFIGQPTKNALEDYIQHGRAHLSPKIASVGLFINRYGNRLNARSIQKIVKSYALKSGIGQNIHPHSIRHTFATHLIEGNADLRSVQELLGHSSPTTTQIYTHIGQPEIRKVYLNSHPRGNKSA